MDAKLIWPLATGLGIRVRLEQAWSTDRGYHDLRHLAEVLDRLDELGAGADVEVLLAAWFHDAIHTGTPGNDDEERSAQLAIRELTPLASEVDVAEVARLVRLTAYHDPAPGDLRGAQLSDADLGILAAPASRYREYAADVRREYAAVPDADFARGRLEVLRNLAGRGHLFRTAYAREHWEAAARTNLAEEISDLEDALDGAGPRR